MNESVAALLKREGILKYKGKLIFPEGKLHYFYGNAYASLKLAKEAIDRHWKEKEARGQVTKY